MPLKKEISLLPDEHNPNLLSARIIKWVVTVGRFVIVFTELIVICAFISRFWLDRKNSDLSEITRQQKAILESTSQFENDYNALSRKLSAIKGIYTSQPDYTPGLDSIVSSTPNDIVYKELTVEKPVDLTNIKADLSVYALNENSIIEFITNLLLNPEFDSVSVDTIEKKPKDSKYTVDLSLIINKPTNAPKQ